MPVKYYFHAIHIPSGKTWMDERYFESRIRFLEELNTWNRRGGGAYVYWEVSEDVYDRYVKAKEAAANKTS
jgi:hypothetical protein